MVHKKPCCICSLLTLTNKLRHLPFNKDLKITVTKILVDWKSEKEKGALWRRALYKILRIRTLYIYKFLFKYHSL